MTNKKIGYIRISTIYQNPDRQLEGKNLDKIFIDKASGKSANRPQLQEMLDYIRDGDVIFVHSMDRLARNLVDMREIVRKVILKKAQIKFIKESLTFPSEKLPISQLMLSILGSFAEFERALIKERQREGIELAKRKGVYRGRKNKLSESDVQNIKELIKNRNKIAAIARDYQVSRETIYRYIRNKS